uniref:Ig-like domain-containing protein n=1 Tax=Anabas testudineus TaxID=64144 RepID=A0A3Q1K4K4_ANATE
MKPPVFALCVTCLLVGLMTDVTALEEASSLHFKSVHVGQNVTLTCFFGDSVAVMFYWNKQTLGEKPQVVSKFFKHNKNGILLDKFENDSHFQLETAVGKNHLIISNVQMSDSATYYCVSCYSYVFEFLENIIISVEHSDSNIQALVYQSASETIQPGGSVTLNCTVHTGSCDGEHSVYWFKDSEESHPGIIYTHGDKNDQCERKPDTQTNTCIYNLSLDNLNMSHAGTYYCAVASCGSIMFGNGTKLDFEDVNNSLVLVYFLCGALAFNTILVVFLTYITYRLKTNCCHCTDVQERSSCPLSYQDVENLHYAALKQNKISRPKRQRHDTGSECVYSSVRH